MAWRETPALRRVASCLANISVTPCHVVEFHRKVRGFRGLRRGIDGVCRHWAYAVNHKMPSTGCPDVSGSSRSGAFAPRQALNESESTRQSPANRGGASIEQSRKPACAKQAEILSPRAQSLQFPFFRRIARRLHVRSLVQS